MSLAVTETDLGPITWTKNAAVQTVNSASVTALLNFVTTNNRSYYIRVEGTGWCSASTASPTNANKSQAFLTTYKVNNIAGTVTSAAINSQILSDGSWTGGAPAGPSLTAAGSTLTVNVAGVATDTINWNVTTQIMQSN